MTNLLAVVTAYCLASQPCASGSWPHIGMVAAPKSIPFGTHVLIEGREFVVEDRMGRAYPDGWDIWMPTEKECRQFGRKKLMITILNKGH